MGREVTILEPSVLIRISRLYHERMSPVELYEATRGVWKMGVRRNEAEYAFSVADGEIKEVYRIEAWLPAGTQFYETRPRKDIEIEGRWEFKGEIASNDMRAHYIGRSVKGYFSQGAAYPVTYLNC